MIDNSVDVDQRTHTSAISRDTLNTASMLSLGFSLLFWTWFGYLSGVHAYKLVRILEDFDTELPPLTMAVLRIPPPAYLAACVLIGVGLVVKECLMSDKGVTLIVNVTTCGIAIILTGIYQHAMLLPLTNLIQSVAV